jgi:hypothetical protein
VLSPARIHSIRICHSFFRDDTILEFSLAPPLRLQSRSGNNPGATRPFAASGKRVERSSAE